MSIHLIYYTRSNTSKRIAERLGQDLKASVYPLTDDKNWSGIFGYIKAGYYASSNKAVNISLDLEALQADQIIIVTPLWAGGLTPAVKRLLDDHPNLVAPIVFTNDGSDVNKAFKKTQSAYPRLKDFYGITKKMDHEDEMIHKIKQSLG